MGQPGAHARLPPWPVVLGRLDLCRGQLADVRDRDVRPEYPERCDGTRALGCSNEVLVAFDCAQVGATCNLEGTSAQCVGSGSACTASRCDGTKLIRCTGGHEYTYQCAEMFQGGTCVDDGRSGHSCGFGPDCGETATCNGNTSQLCVLGAQISIDCVASGYAGCSLGSCLTATFPP